MDSSRKSYNKVAGAGGKKKAVILTESHTVPEVLARVKGFCEDNGFTVEVMPNSRENRIKAVEHVPHDVRENSVCYIGGAHAGNDPELVEKVRELALAVTNAGYSTVYPGGSEGMMGVLVDTVRKAGKPLVSVYSMDVAHAYLEKLDAGVESILIAPNERVRQILYHLCSGAQIALPGGSGTMTEAAMHFYQNAQMGIIYRDPQYFGPENYPSPMIYFSPSTPKVEEAYKKLVSEKFYKDDPAMQKLILENPMNVGYWDFVAQAYKGLVEMGFLKEEHMAFIKMRKTPEKIVEQLDHWRDPKVREGMITHMNVHYQDAKRKLHHILGFE